MFRYQTVIFASVLTLSLSFLSIGCSAQMTEEQALSNLREMSRDGRSPSESYVAGIESRFAGKRTGLLARLLRAKIKFDNRDFAGAAAHLNTDEFQSKTKVADHALWLRGRALQEAGDHAAAMAAFERLASDLPDSIHATNARLQWAASAIRMGRGAEVSPRLKDLIEARNPEANLRAAEAAEASGDQPGAIQFYRRAYFYGAGTDAGKLAEARLIALSQPLTPQSVDEAQHRADRLFKAKDFTGADKAFADLAAGFPTAMSSAIRLRQLATLSSVKKATEAQSVFNAIPASAPEKEEAYYYLALAHARARQWPQARTILEEMQRKYPTGKFTAKAWVDVGMAARDAKNKLEEQSFLRAAVANYPDALEVAGAQFELAWLEHENKNFAVSSRMLTEHLARYAQRDTTNRGKAGYWAARDSERAGKTAEACALYDAVLYRYSANWYGYLAQQRLAAMSCPAGQPAAGSLVARAVAALKTITVAPETASARDVMRAEKGEELG